MKKSSVILICVFLLSSHLAFAKGVEAQVRLYGGITQADPKEVNTELAAQGLKKVDATLQYGIEATFPVFKLLDLGLRYGRNAVNVDEDPNNILTSYHASINQDAIYGILRIPYIKTNFVRADIFGGYGGVNTVYKISNPSQHGELNRKTDVGWFGSACSTFGASVAVGYQKYFLVFEGGYNSNKITGLKSDGNINDHIKTIDLSGTYVSIGFMFNAVPEGSSK
jgi:hypothetical protein